MSVDDIIVASNRPEKGARKVFLVPSHSGARNNRSVKRKTTGLKW